MYSPLLRLRCRWCRRKEEFRLFLTWTPAMTRSRMRINKVVTPPMITPKIGVKMAEERSVSWASHMCWSSIAINEYVEWLNSNWIFLYEWRVHRKKSIRVFGFSFLCSWAIDRHHHMKEDASKSDFFNSIRLKWWWNKREKWLEDHSSPFCIHLINRMECERAFVNWEEKF